MPRRWKIWMDRFRGRRSALPSLDVLASSASSTDTLENRLNWLVDVVQWVRRPGHEHKVQALPELDVQVGRLKRFLEVLDRNPEWKKSVARTLRSIIRETSALELFTETGLPRQYGMFREIGERFARKLLPPPGSAELGVLFDRLFPHPNDDAWIEKLDEVTLQRFRELIEFEILPEELGWNALAEELEDSLFHLCAQLRVVGGSASIRARIKHQRLRELPFFKMTSTLQAALDALENMDADTMRAELNHLQGLIERGHRAVEEVLAHLETRGVSTDVVYQLAFIEALLSRLEVLLELNFAQSQPLTRIGAFVAMLARQNRARESVTELFRQNFQLLSRKILERNAETGEHYFTRTPGEYVEMLQRAGGGGIIMAFTTWFKIILLGFGLPGLMEGFAASLNYSSGFVAIQLTGSTLATKQPANTAPALAARMHQVREPKAMTALVNEIVCLIRSQFASIVGNLALIIPTTVLLHFLILWITGHPMMPAKAAPANLDTFSILGPSLFYGAFTGVLLWASSLVGAWADNWFVCHRIGEALASDRRFVRTMGTSRALRFSRFWSRNIAGLAGNISFGFMLGLIPELAHFAGIPLNIRHITLSTSMVAADALAMGVGTLTTAPFWLAVFGVMGIGFMNVLVSFSLALMLAIRARGIDSPERQAIYSAMWERLRRQPLSFFLPVGTANLATEPAAEPV